MDFIKINIFFLTYLKSNNFSVLKYAIISLRKFIDTTKFDIYIFYNNIVLNCDRFESNFILFYFDLW